MGHFVWIRDRARLYPDNNGQGLVNSAVVSTILQDDFFRRTVPGRSKSVYFRRCPTVTVAVMSMTRTCLQSCSRSYKWPVIGLVLLFATALAFFCVTLWIGPPRCLHRSPTSLFREEGLPRKRVVIPLNDITRSPLTRAKRISIL